MMSFAGVMLSDPETTEVGEWIQQNISPHELFPLSYQTWPGSLGGTAVLESTPDEERSVIIGSFWWPSGASRFARAYFVVSEAQLNAIRTAVQTPAGTNKVATGTNKAATLLLRDGTNTVEAEMWMLPAWPLLTAVAGAGAYLLTLVDERYWWWSLPASIAVDVGTTTWLDLYEAIGDALGVTISVDTIPAAYGLPTDDYASGYQSLPGLLDAVAFSVGQRIVRGLDGTVTAQNATTAIASVTAQLATVVAPYTGGRLSLLPG